MIQRDNCTWSTSSSNSYHSFGSARAPGNRPPSRGVHEISPMKAANGGMLHTLFDYSHPHLLGGLPNRRKHRFKPRSPLAPPPPALRQPHAQRRDEPHAPSALRDPGVEGAADLAVSGSSHHDGGSSREDEDMRRRGSLRRTLGRRLPRCLVMHGTADATVPFSQTAAVASALRVLGVPTTVRFDPGGE